MADPGYEAQLRQLERRRAIADAMMQNAINPQMPQGGGRITPLAVLAQGASGILAARRGKQVDKEYGDIAKAMATDRASRQRAALESLGQPAPQNQPPPLLRNPNPQDMSAPSQQASMVDRLSAMQNAIDAGIDPNVVKASLPQAGGQTKAIQEYEFARQQGFQGSFQDWITAGGQSSRPSSVQEWDFYNSLPQEQQRLYLEMKRNPNMQVKDVNQVPTVIAPSVRGTTTTPLSSLQSEASAAGAIKQAEAQGGAVGKAAGEVEGGIQTKGSSAVTTLGTLDLADPLIDASTGSLFGSAADKVAGAFGKSLSGAEANAQLQILQANLMTTMPRMEGPQSNADVKLYEKAAGQIGNPTVPPGIKKAAVKTIRALQQKYIDRATSVTPAAAPAPSIDDLLKKYGGS